MRTPGLAACPFRGPTSMQQEDLSGLCFCSRHQRLRQPRQATQGRHKKVCQNMFLVRTLKSRRKDGERGAVEPRSRCNGRLETPPVPTADLAHVARWGADSASASTVCSTHVAESLGSGLNGKASPLPDTCSHTCQHSQHRATGFPWLVQTKKDRQRFFTEQAEKDTPRK